jgi:hypothetical protein
MVSSLIVRILTFDYQPKESYLASKVYPPVLVPETKSKLWFKTRRFRVLFPFG